MPKYMLFAARDGHVLRDESFQDDVAAAEAWAAMRIADEFDLKDQQRRDYGKAIAECDGVLLERAR